jgi:2-methylisocitrate lyase-like PEP mutase family enzyme
MSDNRLKAIVAARDATIVPGASNALFARVIGKFGFETVYISGAGIANMLLGAPDIRGSLNSVCDRPTSFEERQRVAQNDKYDRFETLYTNGSTAADR